MHGTGRSSGEASKLSAEVERLSADGSTAVFAVAFPGRCAKLLQQAVTDPNLGSVDWLGIENLVNPDILADPRMRSSWRMSD